MLDLVQRYTHGIDWRTLKSAHIMLEETNAFAQGEDAKLRADWPKWAVR